MTVAGERPSRRFRLLFLSHSPGMGGAERCLVELTSALRELGHTCVVALPGAGPLLDALRREGVRTAVTEIPWWVSPAPPRVRTRAGSMAKIGPASFHLSRLVVREGCDVVLTNTLATPVGALAARLAGRPHVWLVHELARRSQGFWWHLPEAWALRLVDRFSAAVVANSSATQTRFASHVHRALLVRIYPSVTPVRVRPMPRRDVRVALIVGQRNSTPITSSKARGPSNRSVRIDPHCMWTSAHMWATWVSLLPSSGQLSSTSGRRGYRTGISASSVPA